MSSRNFFLLFSWPDLLYQIGIRCLAATQCDRIRNTDTLYQIGIRCLAATEGLATL